MDRPARRLALAPLVAATYFIVAGGPYGLEDVVAGYGYSRALLLLLLIPFAWSFPVALATGELAAAMPETGGYYVWVRRGLGPFWGLQKAWLQLAVNVIDLALYPALLVAYLAQVWPGLDSLTLGSAGWTVGAAMIAACALWNMAGIRAVAIGAEWMVLATLAPFLAIAAVAVASLPSGGLARAAAALSAAPPATDLSAWGAALTAVMWNYMGWNNASTFAGEVADPPRNYPRGMLASVLLVMASYVLPVLASTVSGVPAETWRFGSWVTVGRSLGGAAVAWLVVAGGAVMAIGMFNAILLSWSRLPVALAEDGLVPAVFARRARRTGAPFVALGVGAMLVALSVGLGLRSLLQIDVLVSGLGLVLEFAALIALRLREPELPRPFRVPGGLAGAVLVAVPPTALLVVAAVVLWREPALGPLGAGDLVLALCLVGVLWHLALRPRGAEVRRPG